ncbi:hypothetical protein [uncultured Oscillibacter sp.]|uniref:hypothetical protein n=1 Tax=uncultured Oscillibacter sp. TaxID=876091 RepID=UPI0025D4A24D|nr:hypothetical protein [uncultured Oscillibacter sp.]
MLRRLCLPSSNFFYIFRRGQKLRRYFFSVLWKADGAMRRFLIASFLSARENPRALWKATPKR